MPIEMHAELKKTLSDAFSFSDAVNKGPGHVLSDSFSLVDVTPIFSIVRILSNILGLEDTYSRTWDVGNRDYTDAFSMVEAYDRTWDVVRTYSQELGLRGTETNQPTKLQSESLSLSDPTIIFSIIKLQEDTMTLTDGDTQLLGKIFSEIFGFADTYARVWDSLKEYTEGITLTPEYSIQHDPKAYTEAFNLTDTFEGLNIQWGDFDETLSLSDPTIIFSTIKLLSDTLNLSDGDLNQILRLFTETLSLTDSILGGPGWFGIEAMSLSDATITRQITKLQEDTLTLVGSLTKYMTLRDLLETMTLTDADSKEWDSILSEVLGLGDTYSRAAMTWARTYTDILQLLDTDEQLRLRALYETFGLSDVVDPAWTLGRIFTEALSLGDKFLKWVFDGTALSAARDDIEAIITNEGIEATLIRQTETTDGVGGVTAVSEEEYTIYMAIQDTIREDRKISDMGLAVPGIAKVFMFYEYPDSITGNGDVTAQTGDMIKDDDDKYWRIEQVNGEREMEGGEVFKSATIRRIGLDQ